MGVYVARVFVCAFCAVSVCVVEVWEEVEDGE